MANNFDDADKPVSMFDMLASLDFDSDESNFDDPLAHRRVKASIPENFSFSMHWMGVHVGNLVFKNGFWDFSATERLGVRLSEGVAGIDNSNVPYFVDSLMPESWISDAGSDLDIFDPNCGDRYLSNIVIRPSHRTTPILFDALAAGIFLFRDVQHVFKGEVDNCFMPEVSGVMGSHQDPFRRYDQYAAMANDVNTPKMSGAQNKLPAFLTEDGVLTEARGNSFTHILKFPRSAIGKDSTMGSIEWMSLMLAKKAGLPTEDFALLSIEGVGPVLAVERFDVIKEGDKHAVLSEDMCSVLSLRRYDKAGADMATVMQEVMRVSTDPEADARILLLQNIFSYYIGNDDLHLKNISLLKICNESMSTIESIRLSPVYDVMTIWPYNGFSNAALPIAGEYQYSFESFVHLGEIGGIDRNEVAQMCVDTKNAILEGLPDLLQSLPGVICEHKSSISQICDVVDWLTASDSRMHTIAKDADEFLALAKANRSAPRP